MQLWETGFAIALNVRSATRDICWDSVRILTDPISFPSPEVPGKRGPFTARAARPTLPVAGIQGK
jgi:hypothetical protein